MCHAWHNRDTIGSACLNWHPIVLHEKDKKMNAQFRLFDTATGLPVSVVVEQGETISIEWIQQLMAGVDEILQTGMFDTKQHDPRQSEGQGAADGSKVETIIGYVLGKAMDKRLKKPMPRLFLYVEYRPFAAYTVFHEYIPTLPAGFLAEIKDYLAAFDKPEAKMDVLPGQLQAPAKDQAQATGIYRECLFDIAVTPALDYDGNIKTNSGGYAIFEYKPGLESSQGHADQRDAQVSTLSDATKGTLHALGMAFYGDEWDNKRTAMVKVFKKASSNDLTEEEAGQIIAGIEKRSRETVLTAISDMNMSTQQVRALYKDYNVVNIDGAYGVKLSKIVTHVGGLYEKWKREQEAKQRGVDFATDIPF